MRVNTNALIDIECGSAQLDASAFDGPVSYTHLRAHETVLDLVCRLLLEKKNKKKIKKKNKKTNKQQKKKNKKANIKST